MWIRYQGIYLDSSYVVLRAGFRQIFCHNLSEVCRINFVPKKQGDINFRSALVVGGDFFTIIFVLLIQKLVAEIGQGFSAIFHHLLLVKGK
jgi:hypothetical protein